MLFWVFVGILLLGIVLWWATYTLDYSEILDFLSVLFCVPGAIAVFVSLAIIIGTHVGIDGYVARMNERYDNLVYQYENNIYDNDNDIGKRELMTDIQDWNEDLASRKVNQRDFWIGIYIPNIYDQFEFIEME